MLQQSISHVDVGAVTQPQERGENYPLHRTSRGPLPLLGLRLSQLFQSIRNERGLRSHSSPSMLVILRMADHSRAWTGIDVLYSFC